MNNLISRQAAIDALNSLQKFNLIDSNEYLHGVGVRLKFAVQELERLPSIEPEIIRCKDCKHNNDCEIQYSAQSGDEFYCGYAERREE